MNMSVHSVAGSATGLFQNRQNKIQNKNTKALQENLSKMVSRANENMAAQKREAKANNKANRVNVTTYTDKEGRVHKSFSGTGTSVVETMKKYATEKKKDSAKVKKKLQYSYQKVSNQVLMAKNSMSASKAVLSAKRGLADLQRKLKMTECSDDEKQAALAHAKRMVSIAKKKKKNLDLEELVENTMKMDERNEKISESGGLGEYEKIAFEDEYEEDGSSENFDEEFNEELLDEISDEELLSDTEDMQSILSEELMDMEDESEGTEMEEMSELLEETFDDLAEEMSEEMEELMDMMEVVDPHMDEEHFERLKLKHRTEEQKALVKADTDYLKAYIKSIQHQSAQHQSSSGVPGGAVSMTGTVDVAVPEVAEAVDTSIGFSVSI